MDAADPQPETLNPREDCLYTEELLVRRLIWSLLILGLAFGLSASLRAESKEVLLFPLGQASSVQPPEDFNLSNEMLNALYARLKAIPGVHLERFRPSHPSVQRAMMEQRLRRDRLQPPYNVKEADGTWLAVRVAREFGSTHTLAGSIEEFNYNSQTRQLTLTVSLDLIQVSDGQVLFSAAETGRARAADSTPDMNVLSVQAINDVVSKLGVGLEDRLKPSEDAVEKAPVLKKRRDQGGLFALFGVLLLTGLRFAIDQ